MDHFIWFVSITITNNKVMVVGNHAEVIAMMSKEEFVRLAPKCLKVDQDSDGLSVELLKQIQPHTLVLSPPPKDLSFLKDLHDLERLGIETEYNECTIDPEFRLDWISHLTHFESDHDAFTKDRDDVRQFEGHLSLPKHEYEELACTSLQVKELSQFRGPNLTVLDVGCLNKEFDLGVFPNLKTLLIDRLLVNIKLTDSITEFGLQFPCIGKFNPSKFITDLVLKNGLSGPASNQNIINAAKGVFVNLERLWNETSRCSGRTLLWGCGDLADLA